MGFPITTFMYIVWLYPYTQKKTVSLVSKTSILFKDEEPLGSGSLKDLLKPTWPVSDGTGIWAP